MAQGSPARGCQGSAKPLSCPSRPC